MRTCKAGGRAVAVDRGEEVAVVVVVVGGGGGAPARRGAAMHDIAHTNSICPDGTRNACASLAHSLHLNHVTQLLNKYAKH